MQNKVNLEAENYISVQFLGDQTKKSVQESALAAAPLIEKLRNTGNPILALVDISKQGGVSPESNKESLRILELIPLDKMAIVFGTRMDLKEIATEIVSAMGSGEKIRVFEDRPSALGWLLQK